MTKLREFTNGSRETCKIFKKIKYERMKTKVKKSQENNKNRDIPEIYKGINEFKKGYQLCIM